MMIQWMMQNQKTVKDVKKIGTDATCIIRAFSPSDNNNNN